MERSLMHYHVLHWLVKRQKFCTAIVVAHQLQPLTVGVMLRIECNVHVTLNLSHVI